MVFPQSLLDELATNADMVAFEHEGSRVTRRELAELTARVLGGLRATGAKAVALEVSLTPQAFAGFLAAYTLGGRVVGVLPGLPVAQRAHIVGDVDLVVTDDVLARLLEHEPAELKAEADPDDIVRVVYTSGSTGEPKGIAHSYRAIGFRYRWQPSSWTPGLAALIAGASRFLLHGPLASGVMMDYTIRCLLAGGTVVIAPGEPIPQVFATHRITSAVLTVPRAHAMLDALAAEPVDVRSLRALMISGSPVGAQLYSRVQAVLGPVVFNGYGQSENGMISVLAPADAVDEAAMDSVGRPHPDVEISLRDPAGREVATGEVGELFVRSQFLMTGYWGQPELTAEVLADGWLRTQDLASFDDRGLLHLRGRTRDMIIVNATNHYASAIEDALARDETVGQAYVVGRPDPRTGEAVHAFVVPKAALDRERLRELVRELLGANAVPATITELAEVPLTANGKPDKNAMAALLG
jgi:fatty-acyl-CoA synthase